MLEGKGFLPHTSGLLEGTRPVRMSIPTSSCMDIVGKVVLKGEAVVEMLKVVEEKVNLFASSPIGATIQDGGKRKRSVGDSCYTLSHKIRDKGKKKKEKKYKNSSKK